MIEYVHTLSVCDYNRLREAVGWCCIEPSQAKTGLLNSSYLIAAREEGQTVGMARVVADGGYIAIIVDVIVLPSHQGRGIGKEMMRRVMTKIEEALQPGQSVYVNLMAAKGRESFYQQFGFDERPNDAKGCGMTMWISKPNAGETAGADE